LTFEDGVAVVRIELRDLTPDAIGDHMGLVLKISQESGVLTLPVLIDFGELEWAGWEARIAAAEMLRPEWNEKVAFLYHNPVQEVLAHFLANTNRLEFPWMITGDRQAAIDWLRSYDRTLGKETAEPFSPTPAREVAELINRLSLGELIEKLRFGEEMNELDAVKAGLAMLSEDARKLAEGRWKYAEEAEKHRRRLEELIKLRTDEVRHARESLDREVVLRESLASKTAELDGYAHVVSHDLKSPLTAITLSVEMMRQYLAELRTDGRRDQLVEYAEMIDRNARRAFSLINDLLSLAEAGQSPAHVEPVKVSKVIGDIMIEREIEIESKRVNVEVDEDMGVVTAHPIHVYQIFNNLIVNAVRHNTSPEPTLTLNYLGVDAEEAHLFRVCDNGPGIPETDFDRLFTPFYRTGHHSGTGIGLATTRRVISVYGGWIRAYNDNGACFEFSIKDYHQPASTD
jgi:signal transduction histidine kinase